MSRKIVSLGGILLLVAVVFAPTAAYAQSSADQAWSTSITYYTPSDTGGTLQISYYAEGSDTPINADPIPLSPHKAGSLFIGNVSGIGDTFSGSSVLSADVPIVATGVNLAGADYPRPLYSGFDPSCAAEEFFIPTVLNDAFGGQSSLLSIQNVESTSIEATLKVYATGSTVAAFEDTFTIPGQSAEVIASDEMGLGSNFSGSATVETAGGKVVAAAQETDSSSRGAKAFEGVACGSETIYMASMMCEAFGTQTSYYAVQNVGEATANVEIDFYDKEGTKVYTASGISIAEANKVSLNPCMYTGAASDLQGINGSAVIRSTNAVPVPLIAVGKVSGSGRTPTAFVGQAAGNQKVAAAYVRWKADPAAGERAFVSVMNVGDADATDIQVKYYDNMGAEAATDTLATASEPLGQFIKANTNWAAASGSNTDFGVSPFGGAIEVESDQPVVVVVRVSKDVSLGGITKFAEDYNAISVP